MTTRGKFNVGLAVQDPEREIMQAKMELAEAKAIIELLKNNDFGCEIHIGNMKMGVCNNSLLIPVVKHQIQEIKKFLAGKPNQWI